MSFYPIQSYAVELQGETGFYSLKLGGAWTPWRKVSGAEFTAVLMLLKDANTTYDPSKSIFLRRPLTIASFDQVDGPVERTNEANN